MAFFIDQVESPESGIDHRVVRTLFLVLMLVFIASWLPVAIPNFGCAWVIGASTGQAAVLTHAKPGHKAC